MISLKIISHPEEVENEERDLSSTWLSDPKLSNGIFGAFHKLVGMQQKEQSYTIKTSFAEKQRGKL